jgi:hypothetical protein
MDDGRRFYRSQLMSDALYTFALFGVHRVLGLPSHSSEQALTCA